MTSNLTREEWIALERGGLQGEALAAYEAALKQELTMCRVVDGGGPSTTFGSEVMQ